MSRRNRQLFAGAIYHVTARGNRRGETFLDDRDHYIWLQTLEEAASRYGLMVYAMCQMPNHFHLLLQTSEANLSAAMHYLNGKYAQKFNWRHGFTGHVFQGRFDALLIVQQAHLIELLRYIVLNPVRAKLAKNADDWRWSTHRQVCGLLPQSSWLQSAWVLGQFHGQSAAERTQAYRAFVDAGDAPTRQELKARFQSKPSARDGAMPALESFENEHAGKDEAIRAAIASGGYTREQLARHFGVSVRTVSRITSA
ncbi:REP element-mobilizing transposase RayT [Pseudoduganella lurida]|uniref:REP element-mobilizing transposase RayT n=1 Tax=Pseudoduganella lurida TaxID=1036180 RepID=A0A562RLS2_9BURK|nr:transposase [Pseudoduganella lurida]TWI69998.1 REP element-mobilizing transposase RayT [Pseudoduganella lurida]